MRNQFIIHSIAITLVLGGIAWFWPPILWAFIIFGPLVLMGLYDMFQTRHAIKRNFPLLGRGRYMLENMGPKVNQYFIESDAEGTPFHRKYRSIIYQRAKQELDTQAFGTQIDVYKEGYEWMEHSINPLDGEKLNQSPRVMIGGRDCEQPYSASILNISAMSYGSLSKNAILALNGGAKKGGFAHNTGEGGISEYHLRPGGDLIWQIGTGYFGCRDNEGNFYPDSFASKARGETVKMIEIKISQGAKPGHGGILPADKNTPEVAKMRQIEPYKRVNSPPSHTAFNTPAALLEFVQQLRNLSDGKPVGFKLCIGKKSEFLAICKAMFSTGIKPDFITVDGGEGGTGAAPMEFTDAVGMPLRDGLAFVVDALRGFGLKNEIKVIASGKIVFGFHIFRALALGADACNCARAMMLSLGCIQALECNKNTCPTGIATQKPELVNGLSVKNKTGRVVNYHDGTVKTLVEMMAAAGLDSVEKIERRHVNRRVDLNRIVRYDQIFSPLETGCLLEKNTIPDSFKLIMEELDTKV
ncbi:MAG: FMN-binding glutamate synthase family protein [Planctomycetota bacterium]|jgi:glutamate synthase domain-containing protein 2